MLTLEPMGPGFFILFQREDETRRGPGLYIIDTSDDDDIAIILSLLCENNPL